MCADVPLCRHSGVPMLCAQLRGPGTVAGGERERREQSCWVEVGWLVESPGQG